MTRKQRAKIYRKAAKMIAEGYLETDRVGLCALMKREFEVRYYYEDEHKNLPELTLFKSNNWYWWELNKRGNNQRIIALLLSAEMTLTEKL